jgi:hypothetical protein
MTGFWRLQMNTPSRQIWNREWMLFGRDRRPAWKEFGADAGRVFVWFVEISGPHVLMMFGREVFCKVVGQVFVAGAPVYAKLTLLDSITNPVKAHVNCFRVTLLNRVVDDSSSAGIVDLDGGWWLRPTKFFESSLDGRGVLGIVEACSNFSLSGRGHNVAKDAADNVDWTL